MIGDPDPDKDSLEIGRMLRNLETHMKQNQQVEPKPKTRKEVRRDLINVHRALRNFYNGRQS